MFAVPSQAINIVYSSKNRGETFDLVQVWG